MLADLKTNLLQEIEIFKAALDIELKKRSSILGARGTVLQELTSESEVLYNELNLLEDKRVNIIKQLFQESSDRAITLKDIVNSDLIKKTNKQAEFKKIADDYRACALKLHEESNENRRLLVKAGKSLQRVVDSLKEMASDEGYHPAGGAYKKQAIRSTESLLLNANA